MTLLKAAGLEKSYKSRKVVRDLTLEVREGDYMEIGRASCRERV